MTKPTQRGTAPPEQTEEEHEQVRRFKHLTEVVLPARAAQEHWPIRLDHCFKRICLDHAFNEVWYNHIPRPAERHLRGQPLRRALSCAEDLTHGDQKLLQQRNTASLQFRGKSIRPL